MIESNLTLNDQRILLSPIQLAPDRTGLFIALFLLFLLFILISYLFYSFLSFKRFPSQQNNRQNNFIDHNLNNNNKIIFNDNDDLINSNGEIILGRQSSFSDCGTSLRSSIRSHINPNVKRSSSYKLCSQASNYLLTPRLSSQLTANGDECLSSTIIVEPNDIQLANALSRSISKYYERKRKPKLKRLTHSCEELMIQAQNKNRRPLHPTTSLPIRRSLRQTDGNNRQYKRQTSQSSFRRKPTTIYELYKSDRMRISNLLVSDP
jgi:hypothetical protein